MFKGKLLLLTVITFFSLFISCKKERIDEVSPLDALVKTKTEGTNVESYYYDNQNRLSKIVFTSATTASYYHEFTYTDTLISEYRSEEPLYDLYQVLPGGIVRVNCFSNPGLLKLNSNKLYKETASNCQLESHTYDANGFLIMQYFSETDFNNNEQIINDKKNILQITGKGYSYGGADFTENISYQYYLDKINSIGNKNFGKNYLGKSSVNLLKTETKNGETTNYTYLFDALHRVTQQTITKGSTQTIIAYTYY